jgi:hemerythrin
MVSNWRLAMALITWSEDYSVKVPVLDEQHQRLIGLINELHEAMLEGKGRNITVRILVSMVDYAIYHFAAEEEMMKAKGYPGLAAHQAQHEAFRQRVTEFHQQFTAGQVGLTIQIMNFLKDWLVNHIRGTDQKYAPYLSPGI